MFSLGIETSARYCTSTPNSSGAPAVMAAEGCDSLLGNRLLLRARPCPPGELGFFLFGEQPAQVPFGNGFRCVAAPLRRLAPTGVDLSGALETRVDFREPPASLIGAGAWHFQAYFRDSAGGGSGANLSDGLRIELVP